MKTTKQILMKLSVKVTVLSFFKEPLCSFGEEIQTLIFNIHRINIRLITQTQRY